MNAQPVVCVGLSDFLRMSDALRMSPPPVEGVTHCDEPEIPLTIRVCIELSRARSTASEIADVLGLHYKTISGTISNLKRQRWVKEADSVVRGVCGHRVRMYELTAAGRRQIRGMQ